LKLEGDAGKGGKVGKAEAGRKEWWKSKKNEKGREEIEREVEEKGQSRKEGEDWDWRRGERVRKKGQESEERGHHI